MSKFACLAYFIISAVWSLGMGLSLVSMVIVSIFGDLSKNLAGYPLFECLTVIGLFWIPVAIVVAAYTCWDYDAGRIFPLRENWAVLPPLGHCAYYALIAIPVLLQQFCPVFSESSKWSFMYAFGPAALYLLILAAANSLQAYKFARKTTSTSGS
jgi:hypothetical protein